MRVSLASPGHRFHPFRVRSEEILARLSVSNTIGAVALLSLPYLLFAVVLAAQLTLEFDEILTLNISRISSVGEVWNALLHGADGHPPLLYLLTRVSFWLFGEGPVSLRLPSILGLFCMALCLYGWLVKRLPPPLAIAGALFPLVTGAYRQALLARPYGLMLGFCALALFSWQRSERVGHRTAALIGLTVGLAGGLYSHFYAVLVFVPIVIGELFRTVHLKSLDYPVWGAIVAGALPGFVLLPLMSAGRVYSHHFWAQPSLGSVPFAYTNLLGPAALPLILIAGSSAAAMVWSPKPMMPAASHPGVNLRPHELAAALSLAGMPFFVWFVASVYTNAFTGEYAIVSVIGCAALLVALVAPIPNHRNLGRLIAVCFFGVATFQFGQLSRQLLLSSTPAAELDSLRQPSRNGGFQIPTTLDAGSLPIVVSDSHTFGSLTHYATARTKQRLYFLTDHDEAVRYSKADTDDRLLGVMKVWTGWNVQDYSSFVAQNPKFLVYTTHGWLISRLLADRAHIEVLATYEGEYLCEVTLPLPLN